MKRNGKDHIRHLLKEHNRGIRLDLACGTNKQPGFVGMDVRKLPGVDIVHNLEKFPYPLPDQCASLIVASHYVEHINPANFGFVKFMNEIWRLMKPEGQFMVVTPYAGSPGYWQDPTHINGCTETTFRYFDPLDQPTDGTLYRIYQPKPWKIDLCTWNIVGNLEIAMSSRREDKSYHA